jgi:hypothetical protein
MLQIFQQLFLEYSIPVSVIVAIFVLVSAGIIIVHYNSYEDEKNEEMHSWTTTFAGVGVILILIFNFFAFWVMFCPVIGDPSMAQYEKLNSSIRLKSIAVFFMTILALIPNVEIFVKKFLKPEEKHKDTSTTELGLVIGSATVSILIVLYTFINAFMSSNLNMSMSGSSGYGSSGYY